MTRPYRIALTGGIGSGKSTVTRFFLSLGVPVIDSDVISREIVKDNRSALLDIQNYFGNEVLGESGDINRQKLRQIIFDNPVAKKKLENILHPLIYEEIDRRVNNIDYPYCLIVVPLLIETKQYYRYDRILLVDSSMRNQRIRAKKRDNLTDVAIEKILVAQASREERLSYTDDIINNETTIKELEPTVRKFHENYLNYCKKNISCDRYR